MKIIEKRNLILGLAFVIGTAAAQVTNAGNVDVIKTLPLSGGGRWDYIVADSAANRLFIARATHVSVLDLSSGAEIGDIPETPGVHGIAIADDLGIGFITNGGEGKVLVFDLKTLKPVTKITVGEGPDSVVYVKSAHKVFVQNGKSKSSSVIDAEKKQVIATIPISGKPEYTVTDNAGNLYINNADGNSIVNLDTSSNKIKASWKLSGCEEPTGLAIDSSAHTLFSSCGNKVLAVVDATTGKVKQTLPIGEDCDAVAFDPETKLVFASSGEGQVEVIGQQKGRYSVLKTIKTRPGSKTMGLDPAGHRIYIPIADFTGKPTTRPRPSVVPGTIKVLVIGSR